MIGLGSVIDTLLVGLLPSPSGFIGLDSDFSPLLSHQFASTRRAPNSPGGADSGKSLIVFLFSSNSMDDTEGVDVQAQTRTPPNPTHDGPH
jgi:hypothetical protein